MGHLQQDSAASDAAGPAEQELHAAELHVLVTKARPAKCKNCTFDSLVGRSINILLIWIWMYEWWLIHEFVLNVKKLCGVQTKTKGRVNP